MTNDVNGVLLTDGRNRIFLHPPKLYPGGHGFTHQVDLVFGPFQGSFETSSYEGPMALQTFYEQLNALYGSLRGEARLPDSYENLKVYLSGDGLGHFKVRADIWVVPTGDDMDIQFSFSFSIDQTQLPDIAAAVQRVFLNESLRGQ